MPRPESFRKLGLFVLSEFLDAGSCARLRSEMPGAASDKGLVVGDVELDESIRRVSFAHVPKPTKLLVKPRLARVKPKMEERFQASLTGCDGPHFQMYGPGAFYGPHQDASPGSPPHILQRRVSVVIFLNAAAEDPAGDGYGGALTFYGLLQGPEWGKCAFSLETSPGLLIAFRPSVVHELKPITLGQRFAIAAWFTSDSHPDTSSVEHRP